jgi:hypothetical protein
LWCEKRQQREKSQKVDTILLFLIMSDVPDEEDPPTNNHRRSVAQHVRERQRAVAEREALRLARPTSRNAKHKLGHADKRKAAVTSTPFGVVPWKKSTLGPQHSNNDDTTTNEWCGPLAIARQMIAARERQQQEEELEAQQGGEALSSHPLDQVMEQLETERKRKEHPSLQWKPTTTTHMVKNNNNNNTTLSWYTKRQRVQQQTRVRIPTLVDMCLEFLVEQFDYVESLGAIDSGLRNQIAAALVAKHKLHGDALRALVHVGMESLELPDASGITSQDLVQVLQTILPAGLRYLHLDQCGRCFSTPVLQVLLQHPHSLVALSIGGCLFVERYRSGTNISTITSFIFD